MPPETPPAAGFTLETLLATLEARGGDYLGFLEVPTLSCGLYRLPAGGDDRQSPHDLDEVYAVIEGRATLQVGEQRLAAEPGAVLYVAAGVEHRFVDIEADLTVLVMFSKAPPGGRSEER